LSGKEFYTMTQKKILRIILIAAVALFILPVVLAIFQPMHGSAAWERTNDGSFDRLYGADPFSFALSFTSYKNNISSGGNSHENARQPMRLGSLTIVDLSATPLSSRVAHELASDARRLDGVTTVEVRVAGDDVDRHFIGDQILVLEEVSASVSRWLPINRSRAHIRARMGHIPEYGWLDDLETVQAHHQSWSIELKGLYIGFPGGAPATAANSVAENMDLAKVWKAMANIEGPVLREHVNSSEVLPPDLGSSSEVTAAMKLTSPPVLKGRRHARVGEAHWLYEAPDAVDRLEAAVEQLKSSGWQKGAANSGVDGRLHMMRLSRGNEAVRFSYEKNRETMLQNIYNRSSNGGPRERHVEGPASDPVVWIHYFHEGGGFNSPPVAEETSSSSPSTSK
jgi:hypothetical protein